MRATGCSPRWSYPDDRCGRSRPNQRILMMRKCSGRQIGATGRCGSRHHQLFSSVPPAKERTPPKFATAHAQYL